MRGFFIFIQKEIIYRIIEIILGGKNLESSLTVDNRLFSQIEKNIISNIIDILTMELQDVFLLTDSDIKIIRQNICYFQYEYDNLNDDVVFFGRSTIKIKESTGKMDVIIPYNTLLPIKSTLIKTFSNKKLIQQDIWKNHMKKTLNKINTLSQKFSKQKSQQKSNQIIEPPITNKNRFIYLGKIINFNFLKTESKLNILNGFGSNLLDNLIGETKLQKKMMDYKEYKNLRNNIKS
jgi:hypothetical protein